MREIRFSARAYALSILEQGRASLQRVSSDRAALAAIILITLPWWSLIFLRTNTDWLSSFAGIAIFIALFWWMSRSGSTPASDVKWPRLEAAFAIALVFLWMEWRTGICNKLFLFLPGQFNCFNNWQFEILPKLFEMAIFPLAVLLAAGYGLRELGVRPNLRSFWISLPALIVVAGYGLYQHQSKPLAYVESAGTFLAAAGIPEEFLFRALLLTRLEAWWRSPGWALYGSSVIFGLSHLPIDYLVFTQRDWREAWITLLTYQMGYGVVFAFAYQRTRNLWPVALFHALVDAI